MEPMELNGGRFYARKLLNDDRVNDLPAITRALGEPVSDVFVSDALNDWHTDTRYTWAICEQTRIDALAIATLQLGPDPVLEVRPTSSLDTALPNDPILEPKTIGDACEEGTITITRWVEGYLGLKI